MNARKVIWVIWAEWKGGFVWSCLGLCSYKKPFMAICGKAKMPTQVVSHCGHLFFVFGQLPLLHKSSPSHPVVTTMSSTVSVELHLRNNSSQWLRVCHLRGTVGVRYKSYIFFKTWCSKCFPYLLDKRTESQCGCPCPKIIQPRSGKKVICFIFYSICSSTQSFRQSF